MLGRQQIAGIPTAISELFKNAHDAYADAVEVDFYRSDGLFVLRDDGLGMTLEDFENRWLTLGTESKLDATFGIGLPPIDQGKPKRPVLGEKGIGRLAIGAVGPQTLVLTRALRNEKLHDLTAAFVQWSLFRCPGVDLDQIEVPIATFAGGSIPNRSDIEKMVESVRQNLKKLKAQLSPETFNIINAELDRFSLDPDQLDLSLGPPSLRGDGKGTHFYVLPADRSLTAAIDERAEADSFPALRKMLLGFTNTMTPGHPISPIKTAFRDHRTDDDSEELISEQGFFTPEEFTNADHHIQGEFDEYGQFSGTVSVYAEDHENHIVAWDAAQGRKTECGPFRINVAYVQGVSSESTLPPEEWTRLTRKLNQIGGVYIYKDNVRILPYGNTDYDFLDIEKNRTKSAGYYYFSYRRMFGLVEISQKQNPSLSEKAGREGFRENKAYREFRAILMNFFVQIAADFFREGSANAERYLERKAEIDRIEQARRKREKQLTARRVAFSQQLQTYFKDLESAKPEQEVSQLIQTLEQQVRAATKIKDREEASRSLISIEAAAIRSIEELRQRYRVSRPNGVGLSKQMRRDWESSVIESRRLEEKAFVPARNRITQIVGELAAKAKLDVNLRLRLERSITEQIQETQKRASAERRNTNSALQTVNTDVASITREIIQDLEHAINEVRTELARLDLSGMKESAIVEKRDSIESRLNQVSERNINALNSIKEDLQSLHWSRDEGGEFIGMNAMNESIQEELLAMRDRAEADLELTQLGMTINVVNHEFENSIKSVRSNLRRLKSWVDVNQNLLPLYTDLRASFDHIDGYLSLFTPLQRRLYRTAIEISGADISKFLQDLFGPRLQRHNVELKTSRGFLRHKIMGYPSSFYPVFVNLVDNSLFWVKDRPQPRTISLDVREGAMLVSDTGPGIPERDANAIFELGFTRKPGGRGMGLYISKEALAKVGYRIELELKPHSGAIFRIEPSEQKSEK